MNTDNISPAEQAKPGLQITLERGAKRSIVSGRWVIGLVVLCNLLLVLELISLGNQFQAYRLSKERQITLVNLDTRVLDLENNRCTVSTPIVEK